MLSPLYILSIDQGTTGTMVLLVDMHGNIVTHSYKEFSQHYPEPGWVEHDPEEIWNTTHNAIVEVLDKFEKSSIAAIGITNQRETTVVWDRETGEPIYPAIVWQCRRTADRCVYLNKRDYIVTAVKTKTGLLIDPYFSATKIAWILNNVQGAPR